MNDDISKYLELVEKDHYLYDFSDDELVEIIEKFDEWNKTDYAVALKILDDRGKGIPDAEASSLKERRLAHLRQPESATKGWLIFGFATSILGGIIGIFLGQHFHKFKKTIATGEKVYAFDRSTRNNGNLMFRIGIIALAFWTVIGIIKIN